MVLLLVFEFLPLPQLLVELVREHLLDLLYVLGTLLGESLAYFPLSYLLKMTISMKGKYSFSVLNML